MASEFKVEVRGINEGCGSNCSIITMELRNGHKKKILIDCGIRNASILTEKVNYDFDFNPKEIDGVFLTSDSLNHSGKIFRLIQSGYTGQIYASYIVKAFLEDSLKSLKERDENCIYNDVRVSNVLGRINYYDFKTRYTCIEDEESLVEFQFEKSGYNLGATMIYLKCTDLSMENKESVNLFYTGSYGKENIFFDMPNISKDILDSKVTLISEGKIDKDTIIKEEKLKADIEGSIYRNQNIVIDSNPRESAQIVLYKIQQLIDEGKIPFPTKIYIDSKAIEKSNKTYLKLIKQIKADAREFIPRDVRYIHSDEQRNRVFESKSKKIIITDFSSIGKYVEKIEAWKKNKWAIIFMNKSHCKKFYKDDGVKIASKAYVRYNDEGYAHASRDELIELYKKFNNLNAVLIRSGNIESKRNLKDRIITELKMSAYVISSNNVYWIYPTSKLERTKYNLPWRVI